MIDTLAKQLFVGTRRESAGTAEGVSDVVSRMFQNIAALPVSKEEQLLHQCALAWVFETAAFLPETEDFVSLTQSPEDNRKTCTPAAGRILREALAKPWPRLVSEWIAGASGSNTRPRFRALPALLRFATETPVYRSAVRGCIGPRGRWIAQKNPDWRWAAATEKDMEQSETRLWEEGTLSERCEYMIRVREKEPAKSRALIQEGLKGETASNRSKLIALFQHSLSPDDEPVLESLLDDRSIEVRRALASLLSQLPSSALALRMQERMKDCVSMEKGLLRTTCKVEPPEEINEPMKRDSILDKAVSGLGSRAAMLMWMVSFTPLGWWQERGNFSPKEILKAIRKSEWKEALFMGLANAAITQHDPSWITALLESGKTGKFQPDRDALMKAMPRSDLEKWVASSLSPDSISVIESLIHSNDPEIWGPELSKTVLTVVKSAISRRRQDWTLRAYIKDMALFIHPDVLVSALTGWPEAHENWPYYAETGYEFFEIIKLRIELHKELS
ncbi:MAG: DUF5691 domain-containing protein [Desulfococcaceae bacterium]